METNVRNISSSRNETMKKRFSKILNKVNDETKNMIENLIS